MSEINKKIIFIMATIFNIDIDSISENAAPDTLEEWDSLKHMTLIVALEQEFNIRFTDDEVTDLLNLELIKQIISSKIENQL